MLINGGAAVALLAFIGHVWTPHGSPLLKAIAGTLIWFVIGVLLDAISAACFYFTQWSYATSDDSGDKYFIAAVIFHVSAVLLVLTSYGTFAYGTFLVYCALIK